jgi:rod shape-determining protein MreC
MRAPKDFISSHAAGVLLACFTVVSLIGINLETGRDLVNPGGLVKGSATAVQYLLSSIGNFFSETVNSIGELKDLRDEYHNLQEQIKEFQTNIADLSVLQQENDRLREQLGFSRELKNRHIPARIIAMDPGSLFNGMTIDKGLRDGVSTDMPVIAYQDGRHGLVGKILSTGGRSSIILPVFDHDCYVAARFSESRYEGLVGGAGKKEGSLKMLYVKKRAVETIRYEDLVVSSGLRSLYPKDIPIGRVVSIEAPEWQSSLIIEIEPVIDFSRLEYVFVLVQEVD